MEKVMTSLGECPKDKCRLINGTYYLIGDINIEDSGEVYLVNNRFVRFLTGKLVFNHSTKQYQLRNSSLIEGVVRFDGNEAVKGFFDLSTSNLSTIITLINGDKSYVIDESIIPLSYREVISKGEYAHISRYKAREFAKLKLVDQKYKESLSYDSKGITGVYSDLFKKNYNPIICPYIESYAKSIGDLTFGLEFETIKGVIPENKLKSLPLIPLRDGSIQGLEYVTIPLNGKIGIQAIIDSVKELNKRTEYDDSCALHLHIGNVPRTPEFITAFYKLTAHYQDEMFAMFPLYKKYNFGVKRKNYSKPFPVNLISPQISPKINVKNSKEVIDGFSPIFDYLAEVAKFRDYGNDLANVGGHPKDPGGNAKWNITTRYYAVNFIPLIFGNHQTIEFRIHTPTYDTAKILNFLFMCSYLINYTIKNTSAILESSTFFNNNSLSSLLESHIMYNINADSSTKRVLISEMQNYISCRLDRTYRQNSEGNIRGNENLIKFNTMLNLTGNKTYDHSPLQLSKEHFSSFNGASGYNASTNRFKVSKDSNPLIKEVPRGWSSKPRGMRRDEEKASPFSGFISGNSSFSIGKESSISSFEKSVEQSINSGIDTTSFKGEVSSYLESYNAIEEILFTQAKDIKRAEYMMGIIQDSSTSDSIEPGF